MTRLPLLALPQNETHAASLAVLASPLRKLSVDLTALDLHNVFHQSLALDGVGIDVIHGRSKSRRPYYRSGSLDRVLTVMRASPEIRAAVRQSRGVLIFNDGALQRIALHEARRQGLPTALLLDGMISDYATGSAREIPRRLLERLGRRLGSSPINAMLPSEIGMSKVDLMLVIGRHSADVLSRRGALARRIVASGLPRWPSERSDESWPGRVSRLLYLTGAFAWHGDAKTDDLEARDVAHLFQVCSRVGIELEVRVHPRAEWRRYAGLGSTIRADEESMAESILRSDMVVSLISTGLLEAITLGRAALVLCLHPQWSKFARSFAADPMFSPITTTSELTDVLEAYRDGVPDSFYRSQRSGLQKYVAGDGCAATASIAEMLAEMTTR